MPGTSNKNIAEKLVRITAGPVVLEGNLGLPPGVCGVVLFAHGSGSSRHSPRNRAVAEALRKAGLGTLLLDLLTLDEEEADAATGHLRFDIGLLAERLIGATDWLTRHPDTAALADRLFRRQHGRRSGLGGGGGTARPCCRSGFARRPARSGRAVAASCPGGDAPHRRRPR